MRITDIETSLAKAQIYSYVRCILQNSYSLLNGKLEHHEWQQDFSEAYMADVETDGGGKGKERGIGERPAYVSPPPPPTPFLLQQPRLRYKRKKKTKKA